MKNLSKVILAVAILFCTKAMADTGDNTGKHKTILDCENPVYHISFETEPKKVKLDISELLKMKPDLEPEKAVYFNI